MSEKGKRKIIKPEGMDLMSYLNRGAAICNECGALMDLRDDPDGCCGQYVCPACGWTVDELDYEYESRDPLKCADPNEIPPGCAACDGPYPDCKWSCPMFDD